MLCSIIKFFSPSRLGLEVPLAGLLLTVGILSSEATVLTKLQTAAAPHLAQSKAYGKDNFSAQEGKLPQKDGIYLYGQSPKPQQVGQEYMVFEVREGKVIGAFYLPQSEFSCFNGTLQSGNLALMVAYGPDANPYEDSIAVQDSQQVATASGTPIENVYNETDYPYSVALQNYHQLASISGNDQQILRTCKSNYQQ